MRIAWERPLSIIVVASTLYAILSLIGAMIPCEDVPRFEAAANGTTVYVIQSLREALLWPIGVALFWPLLLGTQLFLFPRQPIQPIVTDGEPSALRRCLGWTALGAIVLPFVVVSLALIIVNPYLDFRKVTVGQDKIVLSSAYWSWTIPRLNVQGAEVIRKEHIEARERKVDLQVVVIAKDGTRFESVTVENLNRGDAMCGKYEAVFRSLVDDLQGKRPVKEQERRR